MIHKMLNIASRPDPLEYLFDRSKVYQVTVQLNQGFYPGIPGGNLTINVMATSEKQARSHVRKEMIKMARYWTNQAKVVDLEPNKESDRYGKTRRI